jgi:hypothetical protein
MKYWFDTEFIDGGVKIDLISLGIISEDNRTFYAVSNECSWKTACPWVQANVLRQINAGEGISREKIKEGLLEFLKDDPSPIFWAWYGAYDWVALSQLFGRMLDVPNNWPHFVMDVKQLAIGRGILGIPAQETMKHHALNDAVWTKECYEYIMRAK